MEQPATPLAVPAVSSLRTQLASPMERTLSQDIRNEREELREAAEQTLNVIIDLNLDGTVKWVSPSWTDVVGTPLDDVAGKPISDLIVSDNRNVFADMMVSMKGDNTKSYRLRFSVQLGPLSKLRDVDESSAADTQSEAQRAELEAQGIMVYDSTSGGESHTMWMFRPWTAPQEIQIDLPDVIVDSLGTGAELLASYLTQLAESGLDDLETRPTPASALCRICERYIFPWWFEKHTELCLQEHRAEMDVQMAQETLTEHRHAIVKVLDALEVRKSRPMSGESPGGPMAEYKGLPIGPTSSAQSSASTSLVRSNERTSGFGHARARSFAIRRPQARIVELLMDLCDTAIEISTPALKEISQPDDDEFRTQSPESESRISQVLHWQSPSTNTLEQEQGLALLCADTEQVVRAKVDAVFRHRRIIEYAERIRIEMALLVQDCIDEAMRKAAKIAAGRLSDSTEDEIEEVAESFPQSVDVHDDVSEERRGRMVDDLSPKQSINSPSALAAALRQMDLSSDASNASRPASFVASTRSSSPKECPTPRSTIDSGSVPAGGYSRHARRGSSLQYETELAEADVNWRSSSVASRNAPRTESPISEFGDLRRAASTRQHHRRSLVIPGTSSPRRQESPSRSTQPSSPLRIRPRILPLTEGLASPEASPMLPTSEFSSPTSHPARHHRRQSSAAVSDFVMRAPPSPRMGSSQAPPQARAAQPSIKDFEIIKPISKGAFGSVYLSKKKSTGEYFAIKVLKKADMVAKNQVGNVKAERAIMMWQGSSDFVAKLYWTFSSKDYLYLVMEYLNGGDCASLIKVLGGLPEEWVKKYLGEVVLGVEHLHERDIIHRDLKPDNLLIDQKGHLKLTDFGLSRMGLIGRQKRALNSEMTDCTPDLLKQGPFARSTSMASSRSTSLDLHAHPHSPAGTPILTPDTGGIGQPSYFSLATLPPENRRVSSSHRSDSAGSESLAHLVTSFSLADSDAGSQPLSARPPAVEEESVMHGSPDTIASQPAVKASAEGQSRASLPASNMMPPPMALFDPEDTNRRFVGTPDYLAPETINGDKQDETSDWWSVGCIVFEFLYGIPPFHADEAEQVFENILARRIQWPDEGDCDTISAEAKDLINSLLCMDPRERLGSNRDEKFSSGGEEIRSHPWFQGINWETLLKDEAQFVPQPENPEDTEYFDSRGAVLQSFAEEMEDQMSPQSTSGTMDYAERPHDALSRVRSQVNSMNRKLMPLHIPPHVRDSKSRRLSEPVATDDFGSFTFKNLPVLEKANKDVIQKLRASALAAQNKQSTTSPGGPSSATSPAPLSDGSPMLSAHFQRSISNVKTNNNNNNNNTSSNSSSSHNSHRPQSPSGFGHSNSSPNRISQPSSPLLVSFVAGQGAEGRRKASSNSSSLSRQSGAALQPHPSVDVPKVPPVLAKAATTAAASPIKGRGLTPAPLTLSPQKLVTTPRHGSGSTTRSRSLTVGSNEASPVTSDVLQHHRNRRSQVFDMSPSSSDTEGDKHSALLRVQRRRQSSRRLSQIAFDNGPTFRPLDVLICEDHPVSRMVMEKLLEKLRCRTISVANGSEAVRYSMSEIQFDVIFLEYKLPQISGADVARMIRETQNANSHTPIVAITAYLKELQAPHYFDSLIEKPISSSKLIEVLRGLCQWCPASPSRAVSGPLPFPLTLGPKKANPRADDSPTSSLSAFPGRHSSAMVSSRENSITSSMFDSESVSTDDVPVVISRKATGDWEEGGLGINESDILSGAPDNTSRSAPPLLTQQSAPAQMEHFRTSERGRHRRESGERSALESTESADDEDEEVGGPKTNHRRRSSKPLQGKSVLPSSKLGIEMMRADSHDSVTLASDSTPETVTQDVVAAPLQDAFALTPLVTGSDEAVLSPGSRASTTPTGSNAHAAGKEVAELADLTPRPPPLNRPADTLDKPESKEEETTPRPAHK